MKRVYIHLTIQTNTIYNLNTIKCILLILQQPYFMTETIIKTKSNKQIVIIDNLYNFSEIAGIHKGIIGLNFRIANADEDEVQDIVDKRLVSHIDYRALTSMKLLDVEKLKFISKYIPEEKFKIYASYVNMGLRGDKHQSHSDYYWANGAKTLLYYANKEWNKNWGGETVFFDDKGEEIEYVTPFIPGRLILFDSDIPHLAKEQSSLGPSYRFTLAVKYVSNDL
jgi:SM-20-related protein